MLKTKKTIIIIAFGITALVFWYVAINIIFLAGNKIETVTIGSQKFQTEIVSDKKKLEKGLGGRDGLCYECAMLFQFSNSGKHAFWMKDMRFDLDIVWILNGKIVHIEKNVLKDFSGILIPPVDADFVLEINAGISDKNGFKIGENVLFQ